MEVFKIYYSATSPYAAKARMMAAFGGFAFEAVLIDPGIQPPALLAINPLGKVPVLLGRDGPVFDSRQITVYLDASSNGALHGTEPDERLSSQQLEAFCDGICDCMLAHVMERRTRELEHVNVTLLERYWGKVTRSLDKLIVDLPALPVKATAGHVALRCVLGYLALRFEGKWEEGREPLLQWRDGFDAQYPALTSFLPMQP